MPRRTEVKPGARSMRKTLRELTNNHNARGGGGAAGRSAKSADAKGKDQSESIGDEKDRHEQQQQQQEQAGGGENDDGCLDRLLLVQSQLSSLTRQIDEIVARAFQMKQQATSKDGRREIQPFVHFLSDLLSSLQPWVPRFQEALSGPPRGISIEPGDQQLGQFSASIRNEEDDDFEIESPEQTEMEESLISPSPLVSWRAGCGDGEKSRQLFLLTPLPLSKTLSSAKPHQQHQHQHQHQHQQDLPKSVYDNLSVNPAVVDLPVSLVTIGRDENDDLLEGVAIKATPSVPSKSVATEGKTAYDCLVMTPCLKMSPPKSCVLLEPISESSHKGNAAARLRKSTPFPVGIRSQISESSDSEGSEDLAFKYPELLGIKRAFKSGMGKKDLEASPNWCFSPPKTCVLLEPPDELSLNTVVADHHSPLHVDVSNPQTGLNDSREPDVQGGLHETKNSCNPESKMSSLTLAESTPLWKEPGSIMRIGKRPGENTLKRELWTKFEAASTHGLRLNVFGLQGTARKGFLEMLDEADGESIVPNGYEKKVHCEPVHLQRLELETSLSGSIIRFTELRYIGPSSETDLLSPTRYANFS